MSGRIWTEPEVAILRDMTAAGCTRKEMAERLGRTSSSVECKASDMGFQIRPLMPSWSDEQVERMRALISEGRSSGYVAAALGITRNAAMGKSRRLGLTFCSMPATRLRRAKPAKLPKPPKVVQIRPQRPARPVPEPVPPPTIETQPVAFLDRNMHRQCAYPLWDDDTPFEQKMFCGSPVIPGLSYCHGHFRLTCGSGTPSERNAHKEAA